MAKRPSSGERVARRGDSVVLGYCANVHPGEHLSDVLAAVGHANAVRQQIGVDRLSFGLWLSRGALSDVLRAGADVLREALDAHNLFVVTCNGFPYGNFQAAVVKRSVYHPDWTTAQRFEYTLDLARVLARIAPPEHDELTISTLPLAYRSEADAGTYERSLEQLCRLAEQLASLRDLTGKNVRVCLEPEPGCLLERSSEVVRLFTEDLPRVARRLGVPSDAIDAQLGVCFDTCHQAVVFEQAADVLHDLRAAGVRIGKVQLSSALIVHEPASSAAQAALQDFQEPRYLHQVRTKTSAGALLGVDDLPEAGALPRAAPWRVHFHVPIHRAAVGALGTTREFLEQVLAGLVHSSEPLPHLEVETYTWSVLPEAERPQGSAGLVRGIAQELRWVRDQLARRFGDA